MTNGAAPMEELDDVISEVHHLRERQIEDRQDRALLFERLGKLEQLAGRLDERLGGISATVNRAAGVVAALIVAVAGGLLALLLKR